MIKISNPNQVVVYFSKKEVIKAKEVWLFPDWVILFLFDDTVMVTPRNRVTYVSSDPDKISFGGDMVE